jgi:hypothetical protein
MKNVLKNGDIAYFSSQTKKESHEITHDLVKKTTDMHKHRENV